jgi:aldehyde:ferredoxin oxidoreductase
LLRLYSLWSLFMGYGVFQDILIVNLTSGEIERMPVTEQLARDFIGGQGIGSYLLTQFVKPGADPLGPDNALILSPGQLVGTGVPSASRATFLAKSPTEGGFLGMSNGGGMLQLRNAGFDHLMLLGQSPHPVYIKIADNKVEICDARHLWGKDTFETADILWSELGGEHYDVAAIGPAGENLIRHAAIIGNKHVAWGRTGMGAVMGSKRVKAIAAYGSQPVPVAHPTKLLKHAKTTSADITSDTAGIKVWRDGGTWKIARKGFKPVRNPNSDLWDFDKYDEKFEHHPVACPGCPVGCKHSLKIRPGFKHEGLEFVVGCTYATMNGPFGMGLGLTLMEDMAKIGELVQRLGMDSEVTAGTISLLIELYEKGIVTGQDTGLELQWDDPDLTMKLMHMMAHREGIGDILAEGTSRMAKVFGKGAEQYLVAFKGMSRAQTAHSGGDLRLEMSTRTLAWTLNYRGHGDRHRFPSGGIGRPDQRYSNHIAAFTERPQHFGIPEDELARIEKTDDEFVPWAMRYVQQYNTVAYTLGFCDRGVILNAVPIQRMTELYNYATGLDMTTEDMLRAGRRIWNMEKVWVTMQGQTRADDYPPDRIFAEEVVYKRPSEDPQVYPALNRQRYERILNRYYESEGWDTGTGLPTSETLHNLRLGWAEKNLATFQKSQATPT